MGAFFIHAHAFHYLLEHMDYIYNSVLKSFVYWIDHLGHFLWIIFPRVMGHILLLRIPGDFLLDTRHCKIYLAER